MQTLPTGRARLSQYHPSPRPTQNGAVFPPASPVLRGRRQEGKPGGDLAPPAQPPAGRPLQPQLSWNTIPSCSDAEKWEERAWAWAVGWGAQGTPASPLLPWGYTACPPRSTGPAATRPGHLGLAPSGWLGAAASLCGVMPSKVWVLALGLPPALGLLPLWAPRPCTSACGCENSV